MKKFVRMLFFALVAVLLCATLASCGKVSGAYVCEENAFGSDVKVIYDFGAFSKVTLTVQTESIFADPTFKTYEGKYEITEKDDGQREITFTFEEENDDTKTYGGTKAFSVDKKNDAVKIDLVTYTRTE